MWFFAKKLFIDIYLDTWLLIHFIRPWKNPQLSKLTAECWQPLGHVKLAQLNKNKEKTRHTRWNISLRWLGQTCQTDKTDFRAILLLSNSKRKDWRSWRSSFVYPKHGARPWRIRIYIYMLYDESIESSVDRPLCIIINHL